jgi:hypothetical protein
MLQQVLRSTQHYLGITQASQAAAGPLQIPLCPPISSMTHGGACELQQSPHLLDSDPDLMHGVIVERWR